MRSNYLVQKSAAVRLRNIYSYTLENWGEKQAKEYIEGLFTIFNDIAGKIIISHPISAEFEVRGFYTIYKKHYIYWKELDSGQIGIVTVLHEKMHQSARFKEDE